MRKIVLFISLLALLAAPAGCTLLRLRPTPVPGVLLMVPGWYYFCSPDADNGRLGALYTIPGSPEPTAPAPTDTTIRLYDADGHVLGSYSYRFADSIDCSEGVAIDGMLPWEDPRGRSDTLDFTAAVPWFESAQRLVVYHGTLEVAWISGGEHQPRVRLLYPNGGEVITGTELIVRWEASSEGPIRELAVDYSEDDGQTWTQVAAPGLDETALRLDPGHLPGYDRCRVRVRVSDSFYSSWDVSDGPFTVRYR
jgi:hypothetical protein